MKDTVRGVIANISQTMSGDPEFEFLVGFWNFPGQVCLLTLSVSMHCNFINRTPVVIIILLAC